MRAPDPSDSILLYAARSVEAVILAVVVAGRGGRAWTDGELPPSGAPGHCRAVGVDRATCGVHVVLVLLVEADWDQRPC